MVISCLSLTVPFGELSTSPLYTKSPLSSDRSQGASPRGLSERSSEVNTPPPSADRYGGGLLLSEEQLRYIKEQKQAHREAPDAWARRDLACKSPFFVEFCNHRYRDPQHVIDSLQKMRKKVRDLQLMEPNNEKWKPVEMGAAESFSVRFGVYRTRGDRTHMEDAVSQETIHSLWDGQTMQTARLFALFDGHGGSKSVVFVRENLATFLRNQIEQSPFRDDPATMIWNALKLAYVALHDTLMDEDEQRSGTTALSALITQDHLWIANLGDSRAILVKSNKDIVQLSQDMTPEREENRILHRGGYLWENRTLGKLSVGGSIGYDERIPHRPQITRIPLTEIPPNSFLVLACDGLWNVTSTRQVGAFIIEHSDRSPRDLAKGLEKSARNSGSKDNISVQVVKLPL